MLEPQRDPVDTFTKFADRLAEAGWTSAKAAAARPASATSLGELCTVPRRRCGRLTYWQMKNRAGVVGQQGLGPADRAAGREFPGLRMHLIGHSFGARLVSYRARRPALGPVAGQVGHPAGGRLLAVRVRRPAAVPAPAARRAGRAARPGRRPADGLLLQSRRRRRARSIPLASMAAGDDAAAAEDPLFAVAGHGIRRRVQRRVRSRWARSAPATRSRRGRSSTWTPPTSSRRATRPVGRAQRHLLLPTGLGGRRGGGPQPITVVHVIPPGPARPRGCPTPDPT